MSRYTFDIIKRTPDYKCSVRAMVPGDTYTSGDPTRLLVLDSPFGPPKPNLRYVLTTDGSNQLLEMPVNEAATLVAGPTYDKLKAEHKPLLLKDLLPGDTFVFVDDLTRPLILAKDSVIDLVENKVIDVGPSSFATCEIYLIENLRGVPVAPPPATRESNPFYSWKWRGEHLCQDPGMSEIYLNQDGRVQIEGSAPPDVIVYYLAVRSNDGVLTPSRWHGKSVDHDV